MRSDTAPGSSLPPVVVADPRTFMRGCLACWLEKCARDVQAIVTADAVEGVEKAGSPVPGAVILSASLLPEGCAWLEEQAAAVRGAVPEVPILIILDEADTTTGQEIALTLGLQGFIPTSSSLQIALAALRLVIAGGRYYPHVGTPGASKPGALGGPLQSRHAGKSNLTPREQAVFDLLSEGLPNKLIARQLGMALSTTKIHVHHIIEKLNVQNRTEVAIWGRVVSSTTAKKVVERAASPQMIVHEMR